MTCWPSLVPYAKTLSLSGGDLFYYDTLANNGPNPQPPAIVLIHGLGDEADTWRHVIPLLADAGYRVIAPDLPGFGRSNWKSRISIQGHGKAIIRLITETGAASAEPAVLAGSSLGAGIAELVACKRPDLAKALILIGGCFPVANNISWGLVLLGMPFIGKKWYRNFRSNHNAAWMSLYPYYSDLNGMSGADKDFLRERVIARVESSNQERGYFATLRSMNAYALFGVRTLARKIKAYSGKIAVIWGEEDRVFHPQKAGIFRRLRPDAAFALIAGAGHLPQQEKPATTAKEMIRLMKEE